MKDNVDTLIIVVKSDVQYPRSDMNRNLLNSVLAAS